MGRSAGGVMVLTLHNRQVGAGYVELGHLLVVRVPLALQGDQVGVPQPPARAGERAPELRKGQCVLLPNHAQQPPRCQL